MTIRKIILAGAAIALTISASTTFAQFQNADKAVEYRESVMTVIGTHFGRIGAVVKGDVPYNKDEVAKNAAIVAMMSTLPWQAFGPGTEGGKAKPEVWSDNAKFKAAAEKMQLAAANLNTAAQSGDLDNIKKAFGATGQACKGCHDDFKKK
ncbi:c-type cytochrome [Polynucleobacter asymbioticus]|jgi:cytochrome c556|uniref:Cytochrome c, class II n=2 Tax=Polynucleobacter asymbioticus TaxID=576611 RepID=A4SW30_POLAQ|nr:cytochrome c [Polynucleobacter asymbioticus]ABP33694.1 cytochrome c, class II [Polynucleobacter asymbioticus QLW-P1DMWA-1]APB98362.1 cytochrome C [Polynucleobacter asymbioticus]APC00648.1 cytochrome C [Polynucleobacter asymbioticus]APC05494.1 cytochrome C [Polynucleobacter asymbioticus]